MDDNAFLKEEYKNQPEVDSIMNLIVFIDLIIYFVL